MGDGTAERSGGKPTTTVFLRVLLRKRYMASSTTGDIGVGGGSGTVGAAGAGAGFDAQRIRVTGNVAGQPPFKGSLKHHGWVTTAVRLPAVAESLDPRVLAPAEVEI